MIFVRLRLFVFLAFLSLSVSSLQSTVPRTLVCPELVDGLVGASHEGRNFLVKFSFDSSDEAYPDALGALGVFQMFDVRDLAKSADIYSQEMGGGSYTPDVLQLIPAWQDQSIVFNTISSIRAERITFAYSDFISMADYASYFNDSPYKKRLVEGGSICFGASLPLIQVQATNSYEINRDLSLRGFVQDASTDEKAERLRSELFQKIGLSGNVWDYPGVGDLHIYLGVQSHAEYFLRLRTLDISFLLGALLPTGMQRDQNYPSSIPLSRSAVSMTVHGNLELGLKDYLKVGIMTGMLLERPKHHEMRMPVYAEPAAYSPLLMSTLVNPGLTGWLNPYFKIHNIANNVHLTVNYAYVLHGQDLFKDDRASQTVRSVLNRSVDGNPYGTTYQGQQAAYKKLHENSAWRTRHVGVALTYEPFQANKDAKVNPLLTLGCQFSHRGWNVPKMYHIFASASLQF